MNKVYRIILVDRFKLTQQPTLPPQGNLQSILMPTGLFPYACYPSRPPARTGVVLIYLYSTHIQSPIDCDCRRHSPSLPTVFAYAPRRPIRGAKFQKYIYSPWRRCIKSAVFQSHKYILPTFHLFFLSQSTADRLQDTGWKKRLPVRCSSRYVSSVPLR